jgi:hypothetical protein
MENILGSGKESKKTYRDETGKKIKKKRKIPIKYGGNF